MRLGAESVLGTCAVFGDAESGATVEAADAYRDAAYSHVAITLNIGVDKSVECITMYVRESFADFAGAILRREIDRDVVVAPWQDVEDVILRAFGRRRLTYAEAYFSVVENLRETDVVAFGSHSNSEATEWRLGYGRTMRLVNNDDGSVTISFVDSDGTTHDHVIIESTAAPYLVERKTYSDARRRSGSCTFANAIDAAKGFIKVGLQR
jgi:hypothetical protein